MDRYCLFIDESGVPELSDSSNFCIITGVLIREEDEKIFLFLIERLKKKYRLEFKTHIHAVDIFQHEKDGSFLGKTLRRPMKDLRKSFQNDIWNIIKDYEIRYYTVTIPKDTVRKILGLKDQRWIKSSNFYARIDRQLPMDIGVNAIYYWALKQLSKEDKLKVILESRSGDQFTVRNFGYIQDKNVFSENKWMRSFSEKWRQQVVSLAFANKGVRSAGLELADIISYTSNIYFLQIKKKTTVISKDLISAVCFKAIHKTLNSKHYIELNKKAVKKYLPGFSSRTKRISNYYSSLSESR